MFYSQAHCTEMNLHVARQKIILLTLKMARQEVSRTTHIEEGELRVTHENAILTNITPPLLRRLPTITVSIKQQNLNI